MPSEAALDIWSPTLQGQPGTITTPRTISASAIWPSAGSSCSSTTIPAAKKSLDESRAILEKLSTTNPSEPRYQASLAACYSEIGTVHAKLRATGPRAWTSTRRPEASSRPWSNSIQTNSHTRKSLAENINAIGFAHSTQPDNVAAIKAFLEVRDICESIMKELSSGPKPVWLLNLLALSQSNIGVIHKKNGTIAAGAAVFRAIAGIPIRPGRFSSVGHAISGETCGQLTAKLPSSYHMAHEDSKALMDPKVDRRVSEFGPNAPGAGEFSQLAGYYWNYLGWLHDEARNNAAALRTFSRAPSREATAGGRQG